VERTVEGGWGAVRMKGWMVIGVTGWMASGVRRTVLYIHSLRAIDSPRSKVVIYRSVRFSVPFTGRYTGIRISYRYLGIIIS